MMAMTRTATEARVTPAMSGLLSLEDGLVETVGVEDDDEAVDDMIQYCQLTNHLDHET